MKYLFTLASMLLLGLFLAPRAQAQTQVVPYDTVKKQVIYTEVVNVAGANKDKLYDRAMATLNAMYVNVQEKLATQDRAEGKIVLKGFIKVMLKDSKSGDMLPDPHHIKYKLFVNFKDGKYKYEVSDFHIDKGGVKMTLEKMIEKRSSGDRLDEKLAYIDQDIRKQIEKLKSGLASDKVETKSDW